MWEGGGARSKCMVRAVRGGTLVRVDAAARELLLHWSSKEGFVLREVDGEHLLVRTDALPLIRERFEAMNGELNFEAPLEQGTAHE